MMAASGHRRTALLFFLFLGLSFTFNLWFIASGRFDLAPDEAHYWTWSRRLDFSYYSKGPMVAYLIALSTRFGGDTEFFVRLPAVLLSAGTGLFTFLLARHLWRNDRIGLDAALLLGAMPLASAGSILMTIDAPLVFFWSFTLLMVHRALTSGWNGWWLLAGIGMGLGLLSKYTMALMVPQIGLYLACSQTHRFWKGRPGPYLALGTGLLLFLPVVWWNSTRDWISFRHLFGQVGVGKAGVMPMNSLGEFVGSQAAVVTPVLFFLLMAGIWHVGRRGLASHGDDRALFLFCASAPLLFICAMMSLWTKVQANWAAPAYIGAAIAAAQWRRQSPADGSSARPRPRYRALFAAALITGFIVSAIGHFPESVAYAGFPLPRNLDPTRRVRGWKDLGRQVDEIYHEMRQSGPLFVFSDRYQIASEMMFYMQAHPKTFNIAIGRRMNQFDVWGGTEKVLGWNALFVTAPTREPPPEVLRSFDAVQHQWPGGASHPGLDRADQSWSIFRCYGFKGFASRKLEAY